ncbi:MAG: hypothetical protein HQ536_00415 [Parcubacteria group bacterium]|nr:hypothetical protein [Parcubacteria group bacterium]
MNRITAVVLFLLFAFGCAGQHTEQTTPTTETWQEEVTEEVAISETEEFVIDGESADMVVLRPALVTIHGANTVKEAEESA